MEQSFLPFLRSPIILNLEVETDTTARVWTKKVGHLVGGIKLGRQLVLRYGAPFVHEIAQMAPVMLDFKFFDSTANMEAAVRVLFEIGATVVTVHAGAGLEALTRLATVEKEICRTRPFLIVAETFLNNSSQIMDLADIALKSGLRGLTCSPNEVSPLKTAHPTSFIIASKNTSPTNPTAVLSAGASAFVINAADYNLEESVVKIQAILTELAKISIKPVPVSAKAANPAAMFSGLDFSSLLVPKRADRFPINLNVIIVIMDSKKSVMGEIINISETGVAIKVASGSFEQGWSLMADVMGKRTIRPFQFSGIIQRLGSSGTQLILGVSFSRLGVLEQRIVSDILEQIKKGKVWDGRE